MRGHLEKRGLDRWRLTVGGGWDPETKQYGRIRKPFSGTEAEARAELERLIKESAGGTVGELLDDWLAHVKVGPATKADYASVVENYLRPAFGKKRVENLRARDLDRYYDGLKVGPARIRRIHTVIRLALKQAVRWEWVQTNVALHASPPPVPKPKVNLPPEGAAKKLLGVAAEHDWPMVAYLILAVATGARRAELCGLRWDDFSPGELTIARAVVAVKGYRGLQPTKTDRVRTIAITKATEKVVRRHRVRCQREALKIGMDLPDFLFTTPPSEEPWRPDTAGKRFAELRTLAKLEGFGLHAFRHAMATTLFAAGVDPVTVAGRGGWANPNVPLRTYGHFVPAKDKDAAEVLGKLLG